VFYSWNTVCFDKNRSPSIANWLLLHQGTTDVTLRLVIYVVVCFSILVMGVVWNSLNG
jgi:hypothetical protein